MNAIDELVVILSKLPGFGKRSARRAVLNMIQNKQTLMQPLIDSLEKTYAATKICENCGNIDSVSPCYICHDIRRQNGTICVIEEVADLWAMERSKLFSGQYHVLGGTLSAIDGRGPEDLNIEKLIDRVTLDNIEEVILATNATIDGQTTAHYIAERLKTANIKISMIAHGIPIGGELDYLDDGTIGTALKARRSIG